MLIATDTAVTIESVQADLLGLVVADLGDGTDQPAKASSRPAGALQRRIIR